MCLLDVVCPRWVGRVNYLGVEGINSEQNLKRNIITKDLPAPAAGLIVQWINLETDCFTFDGVPGFASNLLSFHGCKIFSHSLPVGIEAEPLFTPLSIFGWHFSRRGSRETVYSPS